MLAVAEQNLETGKAFSSPSTVERACAAPIAGHASVAVCTLPASDRFFLHRGSALPRSPRFRSAFHHFALLHCRRRPRLPARFGLEFLAGTLRASPRVRKVAIVGARGPTEPMRTLPRGDRRIVRVGFILPLSFDSRPCEVPRPVRVLMRCKSIDAGQV